MKNAFSTPAGGPALRLYHRPLLELLSEAHCLHCSLHQSSSLQKCVLLSIKTGGCPENCGYCAQSIHHQTGLARQPMLSVSDVFSTAIEAKKNGADRFCMGAAWRAPADPRSFSRVLEMVKAVKSLGMEVCATLGMLSREQAKQLKEAGLDAYNHNLDTSAFYYPQIVTTRTYNERIKTLNIARDAGLSICCGGIFGMGEGVEDRCSLLDTLSSFDPHPESIPLNILVPIPGTPLANSPQIQPLDFVRLVAVARILMPTSRIRIAAGRRNMSVELQALAFMAGANSIFIGNKLLTTPNPEDADDKELLNTLYGNC